MRFLHSAPSHQYSVAVYGRPARRDGGQKDSCPPFAPLAQRAGARGYQTTAAIVANIRPSSRERRTAKRMMEHLRYFGAHEHESAHAADTAVILIIII